jgi:hypothetical protein
MILEERLLFADVMVRNITYFVSKNKKFKEIWDKMDKNIKECIKIGLSEMDILKPSMWDAWWAINHGRFSLTGSGQRAMHTIMYHYLTAYSHKKIGTNIQKKKTETE